jgi:hypothetical protein
MPWNIVGSSNSRVKPELVFDASPLSTQYIVFRGQW